MNYILVKNKKFDAINNELLLNKVGIHEISEIKNNKQYRRINLVRSKSQRD
jgi:hypothetical protein